MKRVKSKIKAKPFVPSSSSVVSSAKSSITKTSFLKEHLPSPVTNKPNNIKKRTHANMTS